MTKGPLEKLLNSLMLMYLTDSLLYDERAIRKVTEQSDVDVTNWQPVVNDERAARNVTEESDVDVSNWQLPVTDERADMKVTEQSNVNVSNRQPKEP